MQDLISTLNFNARGTKPNQIKPKKTRQVRTEQTSRDQSEFKRSVEEPKRKKRKPKKWSKRPTCAAWVSSSNCAVGWKSLFSFDSFLWRANPRSFLREVFMALPCTYGTPKQKERAREEEVEKEIVCISLMLDRNLGRRWSTGRDLGSSVCGALARALFVFPFPLSIISRSKEMERRRRMSP